MRNTIKIIQDVEVEYDIFIEKPFASDLNNIERLEKIVKI
jgi:transposase